MMKEFSENPAFVSMMESMRNTFAAADPRNGGAEQSARMNIIKERLRRAQAAKEAARGSNPVTSAPVSVKPVVDYGDDTFASIAVKSSKGKGKKGDVKASQNVNSKVVKDDMD
jgi:hypothetical protein